MIAAKGCTEWTMSDKNQVVDSLIEFVFIYIERRNLVIKKDFTICTGSLL